MEILDNPIVYCNAKKEVGSAGWKTQGMRIVVALVCIHSYVYVLLVVHVSQAFSSPI